MGLGLIFLGFMFFYDFQTALRIPDTDQVHMLIDIFPDAIGWLLLFAGLFALSKKYPSFKTVRNFCVPMFAFSVLMLLGETVFYPAFYPGGEESVTAMTFLLLKNVLIAVFCFLLFGEMSLLAKNRPECPKLSRRFRLSQYFTITEIALYLISFVCGRVIFTQRVLLGAVKIVSACYMLFWVFFIWYNVILLFSAFRKIDD